MTTSPEEPTRREVLEEIKTTRTALENLPARLDAVEKKGNKLQWAIVVVFLLIFGALWNETRNNGNQNDKLDDFAFCQAEYNRVNTEVSKTRAELNTQLNAAQAKRDLAIGKIVAGGKGDINKIFNEYSTRLAEIESARADNPLPVYPDCYTKYIIAEPKPVNQESP